MASLPAGGPASPGLAQMGHSVSLKAAHGPGQAGSGAWVSLLALHSSGHLFPLSLKLLGPRGGAAKFGRAFPLAASPGRHCCTASVSGGGERGPESLLTATALTTRIQKQFQVFNKFSACSLSLPHQYSNMLACFFLSSPQDIFHHF